MIGFTQRRSPFLIHAYSTHVKRARAISLVAEGGVISAQVLNEFSNVLRNKQKQEWSIIESALASVRLRFPDIIPLTADTHGLALARDHVFSFYDALILAAAIETGCDTLWSEHMHHGRVIGGLTVRNPFIDSGGG